MEKQQSTNISGLLITQLKMFEDSRGNLTEVFRRDAEMLQNHSASMAYISWTHAGKSRGPHEHVEQSDLFGFMGPGNFEMHFWDNRQDSETHKKREVLIVGELNPVLVLIPPGVVHGYRAGLLKPAMCINMPNKLYKGWNYSEEVDEIRHEDNEFSKFKFPDRVLTIEVERQMMVACGLSDGNSRERYIKDLI